MDNKRTITAKFASDTTGIATSLPDKKLITYLEMQSMLPEVSSFPINCKDKTLRVINLTGTQADHLTVVLDNQEHIISKNVTDIPYDVATARGQLHCVAKYAPDSGKYNVAILLYKKSSIDWPKRIFVSTATNLFNNVYLMNNYGACLIVSFDNDNGLNPTYD